MNINLLTVFKKEKKNNLLTTYFWHSILRSSWLNPINLNESQMIVCMDLFENVWFSSLFLFLSAYCRRLSCV